MIRAPLAGVRQFGSSVDWAYETDPEPGCANRRIPQHAGRVLGGTSSMNGMVWVKGSDLDYDGWQLPGWAWKDVAPVFARIEQGPMRVGRVPYPDDLSRCFVAAARAAGVCADDDVSGPDLEGAAISPVTIHHGQRWSTARGYLRDQKNLTVVTKAEVGRVIIRNGRAVGVEYRRRERVQQAFADREVVVSAGSYGTPHVLQLSGIGPADHLRRVGITPLVDSLRIGQGLTDHPHVWAIWALAPGYVGLADAANPKWLLQWLLRKRGKFANSGVEAVAHIRSTAELPAPDFQLIFVPGDVLADPRGGKFQPALSVGHSYWTPKSRGSVLVRSSDPASPPAIRMNLLDERDGRRRAHPGGATHARNHRHRTDRIHGRPRTSPRTRLGPRGMHQGNGDHDIPPGLQRRDGQSARQRARREAAGPRRRKPACRRRLGAAADSPRQHERSVDHDRRTVRRFPARSVTRSATARMPAALGCAGTGRPGRGTPNFVGLVVQGSADHA